MKKTYSSLAVAAGLLFSAAINPAETFAGDASSHDSRLALAFAPAPSDELEQRFRQFEFENAPQATIEDEHALNDAWLGMPVTDASGNTVGFVEDAFLDRDGNLTQILVLLHGSDLPVFINQELVEYSEIAVKVELSRNEIASLQ